MTKEAFIKDLIEQLRAFDRRWDLGVKRDPDNYPMEMDEPEWFEQFQAHLESDDRA